MILIDIDIHKTGLHEKAKKKARPIIVKFDRYNVRGNVFCEKRKLKGTGKGIAGRFTTKRTDQLNDTREKYGFNAWLFDGKSVEWCYW